MLEKVEEAAEDREVQIMGAWMDEWMDVYFPLNDKMDFDRK